MKKIKSIITLLISLLLLQINIYAEEELYNVEINCVDKDETILKRENNSYDVGSSVSIDLSEYEIEGYEIESVLFDEDVERNDNLLIIDSLAKDTVITINYSKLIKYRVNYYFESENESLLLKTKESYGRLNEEIPMEEDIETFDNYVLIGKETLTLNDDIDNSINMYYDYASYLVKFDLNGGIDGPEDIYQKYGYKIESLKSPIKDGYDFIGWFKDEDCNEQIDVNNLFVEKDITYYADYKLKEESVPVTIVYYGENANDDRYSYLAEEIVYLPIGTTYTFDSNSENNIVHKHNLSCYGVKDEKPVSLSDYELKGFKLLSPELDDGYVYLYRDRGLINFYKYYYKANGNFYETDESHISYQIGETIELKERFIDAPDYFMKFKPATSCGSEYEFDHSSTITVGEKDNVVAVYLKRSVYTLCFGNNEHFPNDYYGHIEAKWGQMIYEEFNKISNIDNDVRGWQLVDDRGSGVLKVLISMPKENNNYYRKDRAEGHKSINYYIYVDGEYKKIYSTNWSVFASQITESDFIEIEGYEVNTKDSVKAGDYLSLREENNIYYDPKVYELLLVSYPGVTKPYYITYGQTMSVASDYVPEPREAYEEFGGWYLNTSYEGDPIDLNNKLMPAYNLTLYAKWNKKKMNVRFIDNKTALDNTIEIPYGDLITNSPTIEDPNFIGWVKDDSSYLIVNLDNYQVTSDINLYALYKNDIFINYTINYLDKDDNPVAAPTHGNIIKGNKIYVRSKIGNSLYPVYRNEYLPERNDYTFIVDENNHEFNIYYIPINKYSLKLNPIGLKEGDSIIGIISGKGFDNLEIAINKPTTITGFYDNSDYEIEFLNDYSYTYDDLSPINIKTTQDQTIDLTLSKKINDFFNKETYKLNIFN